jgi:hypothetical protein
MRTRLSSIAQLALQSESLVLNAETLELTSLGGVSGVAAKSNGVRPTNQCAALLALGKNALLVALKSLLPINALGIVRSD